MKRIRNSPFQTQKLKCRCRIILFIWVESSAWVLVKRAILTKSDSHNDIRHVERAVYTTIAVYLPVYTTIAVYLIISTYLTTLTYKIRYIAHLHNIVNIIKRKYYRNKCN